MNWILRSSVFVLFATAAACGGDKSSAKPTGPEPQPDAMMPDTGDNTDPDMGGTPDMDPGFDVPTFDREIPGGLLLRMTPGRDTYQPGVRLLPEVEVVDVYGDPAQFEWELVVEPAGAATPVMDRYELAEEGIVRFTACTVENGIDDQPVCGWDEVVVDIGPPTIEITSPVAGAMLDATNDPMITVEGTVTDTFGDVTAFLNGAPLALEADGSFSTEIGARYGVNHIQVEASDGLDSTTSRAVVDVLWANDYAPITDPPLDEVDAVQLRLGQLFVDDRMRPMTLVDGTTVTQDLADIMQLVIQNLDIATLLPDPVVDTSGFFLRIPSIVLGKPNVQIDIVDGGLELFIQIPDLVANTEGSFTFDNTSLDLNGNLTAGLSALITVSVDKPDANTPVSVTVDSISVAVEDASPNFASAEANAIFQLASSILRTTIEDLLRDTLEMSFVTEIPALLGDVFTALESVLAGQTVDLDTGFGAPITLTIDGGLSTITTAFRDHLTAGLSLSANTSSTGAFPMSRGTALLYAREPASFFQQARVQFGLRFSLVNGLLHTLWQGGLLEADVADFVPINVDAALLSAKLPPLIRPPTEGEPNDFVIELGQVEITVDILGDTATYGVNISTGVDLGIQNAALALTVGDVPKIDTWLISSSADSPLVTPEVLKDLIEGQVWPEFTAAFAGGLSIPLPAPDLSGLGSISAPLGGLTLDYREVRPLAVRDGWIVLDATMEGTLPP